MVTKYAVMSNERGVPAGGVSCKYLINNTEARSNMLSSCNVDLCIEACSMLLERHNRRVLRLPFESWHRSSFNDLHDISIDFPDQTNQCTRRHKVS